MTRVAIVHSRVRVEERLLLEAFERSGAEVELIDLRGESFDPEEGGRWSAFDLVLNRCIGLHQSLVSTRALEAHGVRVVNSWRCVETCGDKISTSLALARAGLAAPRTRFAPSVETALECAEALGYPVVIKPAIGSWGRLLARARDRESAQAFLEHKAALGGPSASFFYLQEHIDKPGSDLRVWVAWGETLCAIRRRSAHWITNTALGAQVEGAEVTGEIDRLARGAAAAVEGELVAVDLLECPVRGVLVNEVNHNCEFRNSVQPTGVDIPGEIARRTLEAARAREGAAA